jgi:hypothetical protein
MFLTLPPSLCFIISTNSLVVSCLTVAHCPCGAAVIVARSPSAHKRAACSRHNAERPHVSDTAPVTVLHHFDQFSCSFLLNSYPSSALGCCGRRTQPQCPQTCCLLSTQRGKTLPHQHRHSMFVTLPTHFA